MKKIFLILCLTIFGLTINAQPPEGPANAGMAFGTVVTANDAITADQVTALLDSKEPKAVKVKGKVVDVCKAEGCWLRMETTGGTIMIRMKDHKFFVPVSMHGKTIVADGFASIKETSVDMLRHYAEDAGKSKEEIAAITTAKKEVVIHANGILVL